MLIFKYRRIILFIGDLVLFYLALVLGLVLRRFSLVSADFLIANARIFSLLIPIWAGLFFVVGLYDTKRISRLVNLVNATLQSFAATLLAAMLVLYMFSLQLGVTPKINLIVVLGLMHLLTTLWRRVWTRVVLGQLLVQRVAFLGSNPLIDEIKRELPRTPQLGFKVVPLPELGEPETARQYWRPNGRLRNDLAEHMDVLVVDAQEAERRSGLGGLLMSAAVMSNIPIVTHLDFYEDLFGKIPPEHAAKLDWLLSNVLHQDNRFYVFFKRGLDILAALAGLIVTLPLTALVYLAIKLEGGPAFFVQKRVGHLGRRFVIWKFRTMVVGASKAGPLYKADGGDKRITRLGRLLRDMRLDEIPQLWNVLKGDMSLVGPRPEWTREVRILETSVPHYHLRHLIKPGVTGWAQVNFKATSSEAESVEKLHYDLYYVKNMSLALDLGIILRTIRRVFQKDAALK